VVKKRGASPISTRTGEKRGHQGAWGPRRSISYGSINLNPGLSRTADRAQARGSKLGKGVRPGREGTRNLKGTETVKAVSKESAKIGGTEGRLRVPFKAIERGKPSRPPNS